MTPLRQLLFGLHWVLGINIIVSLINFFTMIWFVRFLGPDVMGNYALIITAVHIMTAWLVPGFNQAVIREPSRADLNAAASVATFIQSIVVLIMSCLAWLVYYLYAADSALQVLWPTALIVVGLVLSFFTYLLAAPFEAAMNYQFLGFLRLGATIIGALVGFVITINGFGIYGLVMRDVTFSIMMLLMVAARSPLALKLHCSKDSLKQILGFTKSLWILNLLERLTVRLDYAFVGFLFNRDALGIYYAVRAAIDGPLGFVLSPIQTLLFSFFCRSNNAFGWAHRKLWSAFSLTFAFTAVGMVMAHLVAPNAVAWFYGPSYQYGSSLIPGLFLYAIAVIWFESMKVYCMSRNDHHSMVVARVVQLATSLILIYPLAGLMGLGGAGLTTGVGALALAIISTYQTRGGVNPGIQYS